MWFVVYGIIIFLKILLLESGESCGVGFICYDKRVEVQVVIDVLNGVIVVFGFIFVVKFVNFFKGIFLVQLQFVLMLFVNEVLRLELNFGGVGFIYYGMINNWFFLLGVVCNFLNYFIN